MRTTRRTGGDNGYRSPEDYASEGRGYEPRSSYTDRYRFEREDTDYRGQGEQENVRNERRNDNQDNYYGSNNSGNRYGNDGRSREWSNHQSGWNDSGSNWGNRGIDNNDRYDNERSNRNSGSRDSNYERGNSDYRSRSRNNYQNDYGPGNDGRYPQDNGYRDWQQHNTDNDDYYHSRNDFPEDEEFDRSNRTTNRYSYNENPNNGRRQGTPVDQRYGSLWNRDNSNNNTAFRRSRQGFGSMSKERIQEPAALDGQAFRKK